MMLTVNKKKLCNNELIHAGFRLCEEINRYGYEAYGRNYLKVGSMEDKSDIKIAHITSVDFKGRNFVRCNAHVIHIKYNDEHDWLNAGLNSEGYGQVQLEAYISPSYDIQDDEEVKTITKEEALKIINDARELAFIIADEWDNNEE